MFQWLRSSAVLVMVVAVCAATAPAQEPQGEYDYEYEPEYDTQSSNLPENRAGNLYVSFSGGAVITEDTEDMLSKEEGFSNTIDFETGYNANVALGAYFDSFDFGAFRTEAELGYRDANIDGFEVDSIGSFNDVSGEFAALSLMGNVYFDLHLTSDLDLYIGGGAGAARTTAELSAEEPGGGVTASLDDHDYVFAYQAMGGLAYRLEPNAVLTLGYRLWTSEDPEYDSAELDAPMMHSIEFGLRVDF